MAIATTWSAPAKGKGGGGGEAFGGGLGGGWGAGGAEGGWGAGGGGGYMGALGGGEGKTPLEDLFPQITPQMQYGKTYGWLDQPRTPQGKAWLERIRAQGRNPTANQLRAYESQFASSDPAVIAEAMKAWELGKVTKETGRVVSLFMPLDVPTSIPSSVNEFLVTQGIGPETIKTPEDLSKATEGLRQDYHDVAQNYLQGQIDWGGANTASVVGILTQIDNILDTGYYGEKLPLFDTLRKYSADAWEKKGYTTVEAERENFPYLYKNYRTPEDVNLAYGGGGGGQPPAGYKPQRKQPAATRSAYIPTEKSAYKQPSYSWNWRQLAPPTRWVTY